MNLFGNIMIRYINSNEFFLKIFFQVRHFCHNNYKIRAVKNIRRLNREKILLF